MSSVKLFILILFIINTPFCFAQNGVSIERQSPSLKQRQLLISINVGAVVNGVNVENDNIYPSSFSTTNTLSFQPSIELSYQKTTHSGLIYGAGINLGRERQSCKLTYDSFSFLNPDDPYLADVPGWDTIYRFKSGYLGFSFFIGYTFAPSSWRKKNLQIETKLTLTRAFYFSGGNFENFGTVNSINDSSFLIVSSYPGAFHITGAWGNQGTGYSPLISNLYIGLKQNINTAIFSTLNFGVWASCNHEFFRKASYLNQQMNVFNYSYSGYGANFKQNPPEAGTSSNDNYINKDLMFGFKLSFGIKL